MGPSTSLLLQGKSFKVLMLRKILVKRQKLVFCFTGKKLKARIQLRYLLLINTAVFIQTSKKLIWRVLYFNPVGVKL